MATTLPETDNWEATFNDGDPGLPVEVEARIRYRDGQGQESERAIRTRRFAPYGDNDHLILAHCHGRKATRTFLVSRIQGFIETGSGELVSDIPGFLTAAYRQSPQGAIDEALARYEAEVLVLLFVGRADGRLMARERECIRRFLTLSDDPTEIREDLLAVALDGLAPTLREFRAGLKQISGDTPARQSALIQSVEELAVARTKVDDFTRAALATVRKSLQPKP